jgi:hypothetical protein
VPRAPADQFEYEVAQVLQEISPEGRPASPESVRRSWIFLGVVMVVETVGLMSLGWWYKRLVGLLLGIVVSLLGSAVRAAPILMAAVARARDRRRAEEIVLERREARARALLESSQSRDSTPALSSGYTAPLLP